MAMTSPNSQEGWYYDHWFVSPKKPLVPAGRKPLLLALTFLVVTAGGIVLAVAARAAAGVGVW